MEWGIWEVGSPDGSGKVLPKSKYIHQIHFYTVHSIILCIHSKASIQFINPFRICSKITKLIMYMKTNK